MIKTETKEIDGKQIMVTQFMGSESIKLFTKLSSIFGPSMAGAMSSVDPSKSLLDSEVGAPGITQAVSLIFEKLTEDAALTLCKRITAATRVDSQELSGELFDMTFGGQLPLMFKIMAFVLEVNYGNFFEGQAGGLIENFKVNLAKEMQGPTPSSTLNQDQ